MCADLIVVYAVSERELSAHSCAGCRQDLIKGIVVQLPPVATLEGDAKRKRKSRPQRYHLTCVASKWRACDQRTPPEAAFDTSALDAGQAAQFGTWLADNASKDKLENETDEEEDENENMNGAVAMDESRVATSPVAATTASTVILVRGDRRLTIERRGVELCATLETSAQMSMPLSSSSSSSSSPPPLTILGQVHCEAFASEAIACNAERSLVHTWMEGAKFTALAGDEG